MFPRMIFFAVFDVKFSFICLTFCRYLTICSCICYLDISLGQHGLKDGNIYRPPRIYNEQINAFINEFSSAVVSLENNNHELIIAGDFNIILLRSNFFDTLASHGLYPQITLPTRFTKTNGTLIDNFFL